MAKYHKKPITQYLTKKTTPIIAEIKSNVVNLIENANQHINQIIKIINKLLK
ncbi:MAG: hypothetical protein Q8S84_05680 [bacterium]|nr:hypothetical protein [bacterium]MDP3380971.1 hypothetical protein [bacterium]